MKTQKDSRLNVGDVPLHLVDIDLSDGFLSGRSVHVDVHDVLGDGLNPKKEGGDASEIEALDEEDEKERNDSLDLEARCVRP